MTSLRRPMLVAAAIALAATVAGACNIEISNAEAKNEWKKSYPYSPGTTLEIQNTNGSVDVQPSSGATIEIVAERVAHGGTDAAAAEALKNIEIQESVAGGTVALDSTQHGAWHWGSYEVRYHVKAPRTLNLKLRGTNEEVTVADMTGTFDVHTTNGRIQATGLAGAAIVGATNGEVDLSFASLADDGLSCETTNGDVSVTLPPNVKARLNLGVTNGDIRTDHLTVEATDSSNRHLSGTIGGGGPLVRISTTNGAISVKGQ